MKHAVARSREPITIEIDATVDERTLCVTVVNSVPRETTGLSDLRGTTGAGVGIINVRRRLEAVFGQRATLDAGLDDGRFVARIRIPEVHQTN